MRWLHPEILWALFTLLIPIAIHLFNFRRFQPLYFSNVKWLKEVQLQTRKQSQLKQLLLLISRLLLFTAIILAFAEPYFPSERTQSASKKQFVSIYIDNSFSMEGQAENGRLLDIARQYGYELIDVFGKNTQYQIVTNNFEGQDQLWISKEEAIERIDGIEASPATKTTEQALLRTVNLPANQKDQVQHSIYLISDFQKSITVFPSRVDSTKKISLIPIIPNQVQNLSIDSVWLENPVQTLENQLELKVRVRNYSNEEALSGITTKINGKEVGIRSVRVNARSFADSSITLTADKTSELQQVELSVQDFPVTYDNTYYLSTRIDREMAVLELYETAESGSLAKLLRNDSFFDFNAVDVSTLQLKQIEKQDLIVLTDLSQITSGLAARLSDFVLSGGVLTLFPAQTPARDQYATLLGSLNAARFGSVEKKELNMSPPDVEHPLYQGVFSSVPKNWNTPAVSKHFELNEGATNNGIDVLSLPDQSSILTEYSVGKGRFYQFSIALDSSFTNFEQHPLFVPTLINMAIHAEPTKANAYTIGKGDAIYLETNMMNQERLYTISGDSSSSSFIPEYRIVNGKPALLTHGQPEQAGFYTLSSKANDSVLLPLAFNFDRKESDPTVLNASELENLITQSSLTNIELLNAEYDNLKAEVIANKNNTPLWKWLIGAALLFVIFELIIIRFYKS